MRNTYFDIYFDFKSETEYADLPANRRDIDSIDTVEAILNDEYDRDEYGWQDEETGETHHVGEVIDALIDHLYNREYTGDEEAFLNLTIQSKGIKGDIADA